MQRIYIKGRRPKSKKEVKEVIASSPADLEVESTSLFGNEYGGPVLDMPDGEVYFVGPDPYTKRNFYGTIKKSGATIRVS